LGFSNELPTVFCHLADCQLTRQTQKLERQLVDRYEWNHDSVVTGYVIANSLWKGTHLLASHVRLLLVGVYVLQWHTTIGNQVYQKLLDERQ
jgi:hypothetical protein